MGALEATLFTGWIHDHLQPFAQELQIAHPAMLKAIACAKKKNDRLDADQNTLRNGRIGPAHQACCSLGLRA